MKDGKKDKAKEARENLRFNQFVSGGEDYRREQLISRIENTVEHMTLSELEALSYELFTRGLIADEV